MRGPPCANVKAASGTPKTPVNTVTSCVAMNNPARLELRVGGRLAHRAHTRGRHVIRLQENLPFVGGARPHDFA